MKQTSDAYRKLRGTLRFLMGNVGDFDPTSDAVPYANLPAFDKYVLRRTAEFVEETRNAYEKYAYAGAVTATQTYVAFLSNVFLDVSKDRLYADAPTSETRRAAQTVIAEVLARYLAAIAPITPHTRGRGAPRDARGAAARALSRCSRTVAGDAGGVDERRGRERGTVLEDGHRHSVGGEQGHRGGARRQNHRREPEAERACTSRTKRRVSGCAIASPNSSVFIVSSLVFVDDAEEASGASSVRVAGAEAVALGLTEAGASVGVRKTEGRSARGAGSTTRRRRWGRTKSTPSCARGARRW